MAAMRLYTKEQFEQEVRSLGLKPTEHFDKTLETCRMWVDAEGHFFSIPDLPPGEKYPDYILAELMVNIEKIRQRKYMDN